MRIIGKYGAIESVCGDSDWSRKYCVDHLWLDVEAERLVATDGVKLIAVEVEVAQDDASGPVQQEVIGLARALGEENIACRRDEIVVRGVRFPRIDPGLPFPDWKRKIERAQELSTNRARIAIDADALADLARAMCGSGLHHVVLEFGIDYAGRSIPEPVIVAKLGASGDSPTLGEALLMPLAWSPNKKGESS